MESISAPNLCANCGKGEEESIKLKKCGACLSVKYCSAACQMAHRPQHKKACKQRAAELYDEKLFKEVEREDCPICFQLLPLGDTKTFEPCCGKVICDGCIHTMKMNERKDLCAFCRTPTTYDYEEVIKRTKKLMDKGNGLAFSNLGICYFDGGMGLPKDYQKANELFLKAGELGCASGYYSLGNSYCVGKGVEVDKKKAIHYFELAAMMGSVEARHNVACTEGQTCNFQRA